MILLAILLSLISGVALPVESYLTGRLLNVFISFNAADDISDFIAANFSNQTCTLQFVQQLLDNASRVSNNIFCDVFEEGNVANSASMFVCDPTDTLNDETSRFSLYFVYLAIGIFVTFFSSHILWTISASRQSKRIRIALYKAILNHPIDWFDTTDVSQLGTQFLNGVENIQAGIGTQAGILIKDIVTFLVGLTWAFAINWKLALTASALLPIMSFLGYINITLGRKSKEKEEKAYLKAGSVATQALSSLRTVLAFGGEEKEQERYSSHTKVSELQAIKGAFIGSLTVGILFIVGLSLFGVTFWYGSVLLVNCEIEGGDVAAIMQLVLSGAFALGAVLPQLGTFISASISAAAVFNIIEEVPPSPVKRRKPESFSGSVEFSRVSFSYPARPNVEILKGLDLVVEAGQSVAIVGPSGSGKSTILQLIHQLYTPTSGQVKLDGVDVQELDPAWLHQNVGVVTQEPVMFNTSIRENILLADSQATQEKMEAACISANAHSFITDLPDGYDTYVGEGGIQLSGGQKQRIAIARALLRNPQILLLDEATSALDNQSERLVQNALEKASKNRTTIIVAHRLSTIQNADVIVCIKDGIIEETGTHDELLAKKGLYAGLVGAQTEGTKADTRPPRVPAQKHFKTAFSLIRTDSKKRIKHLRKVYTETHQTSGWLNYDAGVRQEQVSVLSESMERYGKLFQLWRFIKPDWAITLTGVVLYAIIGATYPIFGTLLATINAAFSESDRDTIIEITRNVSLGVFALAIIAGIFYFLGTFVFSASGERLTTRLRVEFFKSVLHQSVGWHDSEENTTGSLTSILFVDTNNVKNGTGIKLGSIILAITSVLIALAICFYSSWELSLVLMLAFPLLFLAYRLVNKFYYETGSGDDDYLQVSSHVVLETVDNVKTVVSLGAQEYFIGRVNQYLRSHTWGNIKRSFFLSVSIAFTSSLLICVYAAGWRLAAFLLSEGRVGIADVFRVVTAVIITARNITFVLNGVPQSTEAYESARKILSMIKDAEKVTYHGDKKIDVVFGSIAGNSLYFHYPRRPEVKVLRELSVSVSPGETLALVGSSGSGKSTIISLIERFYQPTIGTVTLDRQDISMLDLKWLRSQIGYVPQEPILFNTTIADNIRYGALFREVSDKEIVEVAKACNIHDFIQSLPQGYSTQVGVGGTFLSGGQKQRIAIARALVRNPKILLLDEATSSLDAESEQAVQETLKKARVGRTSIVVAHRLSTVRDANCIAVMQNGKVVESGTHTSLMTKRGAYYDLVTAQVNS